MTPILGYWDIRGIAEPCRYLLHYAGVAFEDVRYEFGQEGKVLEGETWLEKDKYNLGLDLPNLPYYIDGDVKISQSLVILRYLSRKHGLYFPEGNSTDALRLEMMEGHARDIFMNLAFTSFSPLFEQMRTTIGTRFDAKLKETSAFLGNKTWILGDEISHVDFLLFDAIDDVKFLIPDCCAEFENLVQYMRRFADLPGVKEYRKDSKKWPIFSPLMYWGGKGDAPSQ